LSRHPFATLALLPLLALLPSCLQTQTKPQPVEYTITSPYPPGHILAIVPAINQSGSRDFDVLVVSDILFGELQQVHNLTALPLNKSLAAMQRLKIRAIDSPATAQKLAAALGADGLIVPAVTAYDPYNPPTVGMTLQLYSTPSPSARNSPEIQVSAVFNANNQTVLRELRDFAQGRTQNDSALEEQKFLLDADQYMRFVCHAMVRRLMEVQRTRPSDR
jgi:hypothetical protein